MSFPKTDENKTKEVIKNVSKLKIINLENRILTLEKKLKTKKLDNKTKSRYANELEKNRSDLLIAKNLYAKQKAQKNQAETPIISKQIEQAVFKSSIVKFSKLYSSKNKKLRYLLVVLIGILLSLSTLFMVQNSGLYSGGLSGLFQGLARISQATTLKISNNIEAANTVYNVLFWGLYFICNIPLLYLAYKKINRELCILTTLFITSTQITGLVLSNVINGIGDVYIFGNIDKIPTLMWNSGQISLLMIYSVIHSLIAGFLMSILFILGSSTGGSDIITFYYAKVRNKNASVILFYINSLFTAAGVIIGSFGTFMINNNDFSPSVIFGGLLSPYFIFSFISSMLVSVTINHLFPKHKIIKVNIYSEKVDEIRNYLIETNYSHALTINNTIGGYSWTSKKNIETICMYIELPEIINKIRKVDSEALIATQRIVDLDGKIAIAV